MWTWLLYMLRKREQTSSIVKIKRENGTTLVYRENGNVLRVENTTKQYWK